MKIREGDVFCWKLDFSMGQKIESVMAAGFVCVCAGGHVDVKPGVFEEISSCYVPLSLSVSLASSEKDSNFCFSDISCAWWLN